MTRRLISFLLCLSLFFALAGCGKTAPEGGSSQAGASNSGAVSSKKEEPGKTDDTPKFSSSEEVMAASDHYVGLCDQMNNRIIVCDVGEEDWTNDNAVVWEYNDPDCNSVAGIKLRENEYWGGLVVIFCYGGGAKIVSFETKEVLLHTNQTGSNPHSVELLPNGTFIVASSTDDNVRIYAPGQVRHSHSIEFPNAHGVLWDPKYEVVWMEGKDQLSAYAVGGTEDAPKFIPMGGMTYYTPKTSLHDLAPDYTNPDRLFVTCAAGIMVFDKVTEQFSYAYPGGSVGKEQGYAPGCGNFGQDGVFVFTTIRDDTMVYRTHCTNQVGVYIPFGNGRGRMVYRKAPNDAYYKVRVWNSDYQ